MKKVVCITGLMLNTVVFAGVISWDGGTTPTAGGDWGVPVNWSGNVVPTSSDDVTLGSNVQVRIPNGATAQGYAATLNITGTSAGNLLYLTQDGRLTVVGNTTLNSGSVNGTLRFDVGASSSTVDPNIEIGGNFSATKGKLSSVNYRAADAVKEFVVAGDLTAVAGFTFDFQQLSTAQKFSPISVGGVTTLGGANLNFVWGSDNTASSMLLLMENTSANAVVGSFGNATFNVTQYAADGTNYVLRLVDFNNDGYANDVALLAIPEPATIGMLGLGTLITMVIRKRIK